MTGTSKASFLIKYLSVILMATVLLTACGQEQGTSVATPTAANSSSDLLSGVEAGFAAGPEGTPTTNPADCPSVSPPESMVVHTPCVIGVTGDLMTAPKARMTAMGFKPKEALKMELKNPNGETIESYPDLYNANGNGKLLITQGQDFQGDWAMAGQYTQTVEGSESGHKAVGYFYFKPTK